jgi:hypothetical protein
VPGRRISSTTAPIMTMQPTTHMALRRSVPLPAISAGSSRLPASQPRIDGFDAGRCTRF